jgi:hypothetical protein
LCGLLVLIGEVLQAMDAATPARTRIGYNQRWRGWIRSGGLNLSNGAAPPVDRGIVELNMLFLGREGGRLNLLRGVAPPIDRGTVAPNTLDLGGGPLVRRPSLLQFEHLVQALAQCQHGLEAGTGDPLAIAGYAIGRVIEFINSDPEIMDSGITNPLSLIENALHDLRQGGRPSVLFDRPKSGGRPTNQAFDAFKAATAFAVDVLISCKVKRADAGKYVAAEARKLGLRQQNGKDITGRTVLGWRDEIEISKSECGVEVYRMLQAHRAQAQPITDVRQAKVMAAGFLKEARSAGFWFTDVTLTA